MRIVAPFAVGFYCLIVRGGVLDGGRGFFYAFQRMFAEMLLSLYLIEGDLNTVVHRREPKTAVSERGRIGGEQ
jgi:hypothetical protein